jgi:hypothetical protein
MIVPPPVTVVISGRRVDASSAPRIEDGIVMAPLVPFVREIAERIEGDGSGLRYTAVRGSRAVRFAIGRTDARANDTPQQFPRAPYAQAGDVYVPLAVVARDLGACVAYDATSRTLSVVLVPAPLAEMTPSAYAEPPAGELPTFAPKETPQPQATVSGVPHPRRTPILLR